MSVVRPAVPTRRHTEIGVRIRDTRLRKKLRQVDLASAAGISWRHLIRMEQGEGGEPKRETLDRIAEALGVERSELTGTSDEDEESRAVADDHTVMLSALAVALDPFHPRYRELAKESA